MIDASWSHPVVAAVAVIAVLVPTIMHARRRVIADQDRLNTQQHDELRALIDEGLREVLAEVGKLIKIELLKHQLGTPAAREPAGDDAEQDQVAAIVAEIQAAPYARQQVRPDLPPDVGVLPVLHPGGPVTVLGPSAIERLRPPGRSARGTLNGLIGVPIVGALIRSFTAVAQGTATVSSATVSGAAMATVALAPAPPALAVTPPAAIAVQWPGQDVHRQAAPAAPRPTATPSLVPAVSAVADDDVAVPDHIPVPLLDPPAPVEPPRLIVSPTPTPDADVPATPSPSPSASPTLTSSPTPSPTPSPTASGSPAPSAGRLASQTPTPTATALPA